MNGNFRIMNKYQKIVITVFFGLMVCALLFPPYQIAQQGLVALRRWGFLFYPHKIGGAGSIDIATLGVEILLILIIGAFVYFFPKFNSSKNKSNEVIVLKRNNEKE